MGGDSFLLHLPIASMPHEDIMKVIEIYGNEVVPKVKKHFKDKENKKKLFSFKWKKMEEIG